MKYCWGSDVPARGPCHRDLPLSPPARPQPQPICQGSVQASEEASLDSQEDALGRTPCGCGRALFGKSRTFSLQRIDPKKM